MSEVKTNKISSLASNNDITLDPDGTGDVLVAAGHKLGVGETAPLGTVHIRTSDASLTAVNGNADDLILENNGNCGMWICSSTSGEGNINFIDSGDTNIGRIQYTHSDNKMQFRANDIVAATIDSSGNVLVGTTTSNYSAASGFGVIAPSAATYAFVAHANGTSNSTDYVAFSYNGSRIGNITQASTSSVAYNTSSDHRLKENVADMTGAIDRVKALAPKRFNFIVDPDTTVDGFLAHEAQAVVPEAVTGSKDELDADGNAVMQGIDQSKLVPLLVGALKESIAKIETLETKVAALEAGE
jgi:hypothetical protein